MVIFSSVGKGETLKPLSVAANPWLYEVTGGRGAGRLANRRLPRGQSYEYGRLAGRIPRLLEGAFIGNH
ncbi:hypothetical protein Tco_0692872 [Tanacetum coccineum]